MIELKVKKIPDSLYLFMSILAHDYQDYGYDGFVDLWKKSNKRGLENLYLKAYMDYITNRNVEKEKEVFSGKGNTESNTIKEIYLEVDSWYEYEEKGNQVIEELIESSVPEMLKYGFAIKEVQVAIKKSKPMLEHNNEAPKIDYNPSGEIWDRSLELWENRKEDLSTEKPYKSTWIESLITWWWRVTKQVTY